MRSLRGEDAYEGACCDAGDGGEQHGGGGDEDEDEVGAQSAPHDGDEDGGTWDDGCCGDRTCCSLPFDLWNCVNVLEIRIKGKVEAMNFFEVMLLAADAR